MDKFLGSWRFSSAPSPCHAIHERSSEITTANVLRWRSSKKHFFPDLLKRLPVNEVARMNFFMNFACEKKKSSLSYCVWFRIVVSSSQFFQLKIWWIIAKLAGSVRFREFYAPIFLRHTNAITAWVLRFKEHSLGTDHFPFKRSFTIYLIIYVFIAV